MPLLDFDTRWPGRTIRDHAARNPSGLMDLTPPRDEVADGPVVEAVVNHGRWVADCPAEGCFGAELVSLARPVFFCCSCRNQQFEHRLLPVALPADAAKIDQALMRRLPANRNWQPGETLDELRTENKERGV